LQPVAFPFTIDLKANATAKTNIASTTAVPKVTTKPLSLPNPPAPMMPTDPVSIQRFPAA